MCPAFAVRVVAGRDAFFPDSPRAWREWCASLGLTSPLPSKYLRVTRILAAATSHGDAVRPELWACSIDGLCALGKLPPRDLPAFLDSVDISRLGRSRLAEAVSDWLKRPAATLAALAIDYVAGLSPEAARSAATLLPKGRVAEAAAVLRSADTRRG